MNPSPEGESSDDNELREDCDGKLKSRRRKECTSDPESNIAESGNEENALSTS